MSRAPVSRFGRSGNVNLTGLNLARIKQNDFKIDTCRFLARRLALLGYCKDVMGWPNE